MGCTHKTNVRIDLSPLMEKADALIIVPPFIRLDMAHLGAHVLQACAQARGFKVKVLYAGMFLAQEIGEEIYRAMSDNATPLMLGERVFAAPAYGIPLLGRQAAQNLTELDVSSAAGAPPCTIKYERLDQLARHVDSWVGRFADAVAEIGFPVVGCTTIFEQTASSIAILKHVKKRNPETITIIGGSNCAGPMAHGIASLSPDIDFIFAGESEQVFPDFLATVGRGERPSARIIESEPCMDMDGIPTPNFSDYYRQWHHCLEGGVTPFDEVLLPYETSRGCWWGQVHHCTFCGVQNMRYREKSPDRVIRELNSLLAEHPCRSVHNADDIMPHSFFKTLIPRLPKEVPGLDMFFEQKSNMTLHKVDALRKAGVTSVQPGIEALSSSLLARMDKGVTARQNLAALRYMRSVSMRSTWNLLYGFPGDKREDYEHYLTLIPLLHHLHPPKGLGEVHIIRFSPYFKNSEAYGIRNVRPAAVYEDILPEGAVVDQLAYYFAAEYPSVTSQDPDLIANIEALVQEWIESWNTDWLPMLSITRFPPDVYLLTDTRGLPGTEQMQIITREQAAAALVGQPMNRSDVRRAELAWAKENRLCVELDSWYVPLATADVELLSELEAEETHVQATFPVMANIRRSERVVQV